MQCWLTRQNLLTTWTPPPLCILQIRIILASHGLLSKTFEKYDDRVDMVYLSDTVDRIEADKSKDDRIVSLKIYYQ